MDSVSHTTVAHYLLDYVEKTDGVSFDRKAFCFGNLKPDLKGEYLTKRHYPSLMFDEVMQRIRDFIQRFHICEMNGAKLSEELGVICHYITDFFSFPHNDDIYHGNLMAHYIYEKQTSMTIYWRINKTKFDNWAREMWNRIPQTPDALIAFLIEQHRSYVAQASHSINDDISHICRVLATVVCSLIHMTGTTAVAFQTRLRQTA
ncbi:MAG: zinc dependent phospholipase C family protein [Eubacteriales bacterium]|nr:zinc dependent phospholipase C family protein [Eubacteriales bacterium]